MAPASPLHRRVGGLLTEWCAPAHLVLDTACGGDHRVPLFMGDQKGFENKVCDVDALIVRDRQVRIIVEIEESNIKPTQICGKFLTSALASFYSYRDRKCALREVTFVQVLSSAALDPERTRKRLQAEQIAGRLQEFCRAEPNPISEYMLVWDVDVDREADRFRRAVQAVGADSPDSA